MSQTHTEREISRSVDRLRKSYNAADLKVVVSNTDHDLEKELFQSLKPEYSEAAKRLVGSPFGMFFLPSRRSLEEQPQIYVRTDAFKKPADFNDHLIHEFSNYEAWRRWEPELAMYQENAGQHFDEVFDRFDERIRKTAGISGRIQLMRGNHPSQQLANLRQFFIFPIWDTSASVPADHVTVEKGYGDNLVSRKRGLIKSWSEEAPLRHDNARMFVSLNFPYLAYLSFHPISANQEKKLDFSVGNYLGNLGLSRLMDPIRQLRSRLHDIKMPAQNQDMLDAFKATEVMYYQAMSELSSQQSREYWGILADVALQTPV